MGQVRGSVGEVSLKAHGQAAWWSLWHYRIYIYLMPAGSPVCHSPSLYFLPSEVIQLTTQCSGWSKRKMNLFSSNHTIREARFPLTRSYFLPHEKSQAKMISLVLKLCHLGGRVWSNCSFCPFEYVHTRIHIFAPVVCWDSSTGNLDFHKGSLVHRCLSMTVFSWLPDSGQEVLVPVHGPRQGPHQGPGSECLFPDVQVDETPLGSLGEWY